MTNMLEVSPEDFEAISSDICVTFVSDEAVVLPADPAPSPGSDHRADVVIFGGVHALVSVECDADSAAALARHMFDLGADQDVEQDDIVDALGEIANVVGGNVKSLSLVPSHLGLPQVESPAAALEDEAICRVDVIWDGGRLSLSISTGAAAIEAATQQDRISA